MRCPEPDLARPTGEPSPARSWRLPPPVRHRERIRLVLVLADAIQAVPGADAQPGAGLHPFLGIRGRGRGRRWRRRRPVTEIDDLGLALLPPSRRHQSDDRDDDQRARPERQASVLLQAAHAELAVVDVVVRALVDNPDAVRITETQRRGMTMLELTTAPGDMGKIIGRQGRTVSALRTLVALTAEKHGQRAQLDLKD